MTSMFWSRNGWRWNWMQWFLLCLNLRFKKVFSSSNSLILLNCKPRSSQRKQDDTAAGLSQRRAIGTTQWQRRQDSNGSSSHASESSHQRWPSQRGGAWYMSFLKTSRPILRVRKPYQGKSWLVLLEPQWKLEGLECMCLGAWSHAHILYIGCIYRRNSIPVLELFGDLFRSGT